MSSGFFILPTREQIATEPDSLALSMLRNWLGSYLGLKATAPEIVQGMTLRTSEFEMVPVPKLMLAQLSPAESAGPFSPGASGFFPLLAGSGSAAFHAPPQFTVSQASESVATSMKARNADAIVALVKDLASAIEKGDRSSLLGLIAEDYRDPSDRSKAELSKAIERMFKITSERRIILTNVDQYEAVGDDLAVVVSGAWQAEIVGDLGSKLEAESLRLELILTQDGEDRWKIAGVRQG